MSSDAAASTASGRALVAAGLLATQLAACIPVGSSEGGDTTWMLTWDALTRYILSFDAPRLARLRTLLAKGALRDGVALALAHAGDEGMPKGLLKSHAEGEAPAPDDVLQWACTPATRDLLLRMAGVLFLHGDKQAGMEVGKKGRAVGIGCRQ